MPQADRMPPSECQSSPFDPKTRLQILDGDKR